MRVAFPPLVNDRDSVKFIADVAARIVGDENMNREGPYVMASEDFSYMLEKVPGAFIYIGNGGGEGGCEVHNPSYDFNDEIITLGATLVVARGGNQAGEGCPLGRGRATPVARSSASSTMIARLESRAPSI